MNILLTVERATALPSPTDEAIRTWVGQVLTRAKGLKGEHPEISIRIVDDAEAAQFNQTYRSKTGPTNVLSFPADLPPDTGSGLLGDLVICAPLVKKEAAQQHKSEKAHWAHLVIHGVLHLLGYDHTDAKDAEHMEALEIDLLDSLGFPNPYESAQPPEGVLA